MAWIDLNDEKPEPHQICITAFFIGDKFTKPRCAGWDPEKECFIRVEGPFPGIIDATHWMAIPLEYRRCVND